MIHPAFWKGKKVFLTGHTGFKGAWLSLWLSRLGAKVSGYSLSIPTQPSLYELCKNMELLDRSNFGDISNLSDLTNSLQKSEPEIVFHMAAQPIVRESFKHPTQTYMTNVMGTANLLEAVRGCQSLRAFVNVTTDKCYENKEWYWSYRENESLGGHDPYSSSKACSELVTAAYRDTFFNPSGYASHRVGIATARAGNVIGGGDWAVDRLIPDCIRAILRGETIRIRNPHSIRPWQHVLEPLSGYLCLAENLFQNGALFSEAFNFGPIEDSAKPVIWIVKELCDKFQHAAGFSLDNEVHPPEANILKLDISKAKTKLGWKPKWDLETALNKTIEWTFAFKENQNVRDVCFKQIESYE